MAFDFQASYDELNPGDDDYRFYAALAVEVGAGRVLDLGCGTGTLARLMAAQGIHVVGIDPDPDMLRVASSKPAAGHIDWRRGYSDSAGPDSADLAVMSGHVAQVFTDDDAWDQVLTDLHRALIPGGTLAFETRNPGHRKWQQWTAADMYPQYADSLRKQRRYTRQHDGESASDGGGQPREPKNAQP